MTPSLKQLQLKFAGAVLDKNMDPALLSEITVPARVSHPARILDVHREGYFLRLIEGLGETYDATWWILGDQKFFELARGYINHNKSSYYNLSNYGQSFPFYLAESSLPEQYNFLPSLAKLEWEFKEIFHEAQHPSVNQAELQRLLAGENVTLHLSGALRLLRSPHRVIDVWRNRNKPYDEVSFETEGQECIALFKSEGKIFMQDLPEAQFRILEALKQPQDLESALGGLEDIEAEDVSETFAFLVREGLISKIEALAL
jgi:hypothetical protein